MIRVFSNQIKKILQVSIRDQRSTMQYQLHSASHLRLILDVFHMFNMCAILFSKGQHSPNVYTFRNGSLLYHDIPILKEYLNYCIKASIRFLIMIFLAIAYNYFVSFAVFLVNYLIFLSLVILMNRTIYLTKKTFHQQ